MCLTLDRLHVKHDFDRARIILVHLGECGSNVAQRHLVGDEQIGMQDAFGHLANRAREFAALTRRRSSSLL